MRVQRADWRVKMASEVSTPAARKARRLPERAPRAKAQRPAVSGRSMKTSALAATWMYMLRKERAKRAAARVARRWSKRVRAAAQTKGTERPAARAAKMRGAAVDSPRVRKEATYQRKRSGALLSHRSR